ncbi:MAG: redoxin domain-containing protein [Prevotellaceae bacterium]|jgi:thiol-disulfide isomerase/thioredoxin|nr:redoxin domain-containing protein [Prevotellaceae bacterium]
MKKIILLVIASIYMASNVMGQGYKLEVNINNARDSMLLLAIYGGENKYVRDTSFMDSNGKAVFAKDKPLDEGIYIIAMGGTQLFDFIISDSQNQQFAVTTTKDDYINTLHFQNSIENEEFAEFNRYMGTQQKRENALREKIMKNPTDKKIKEEVENEDRAIREDYHSYVEKIAQKFPGTLLTSLAKAMDKPQTPKFDIDESNPKYDSIYTMQYYLFTKQHFFDNYDFTDKRLINTPVFIPSLNYYLDKILVQLPDSIIPMVDTIIQKTQPNQEMKRYVTGYIFNKYLASDIMGMESIVIHLIDNYYLKDEIGGQDSTFMIEIKHYADRNRATLIGKQAANIKMQSLSGQYESVYGIEAPYTLVYFYEPSCGTCKKETPKIYKVYQKYRDKGLQVMAVYTQQNKEEWMSYVAEYGLDWINVWDPRNDNDFRIKYTIYSVPQVFLLDGNKKIIGRRLNSEGLDKILSNLLKNK